MCVRLSRHRSASSLAVPPAPWASALGDQVVPGEDSIGVNGWPAGRRVLDHPVNSWGV